MSACSDGEANVGRGCAGQSCDTATQPPLNQAEACLYRITWGL